MTWTKLQDTIADMGTTTSATPAYGANVTAGNLLVVMVFYNNVSETFTISDSQTNTWVPMYTASSNSSTGQTIMAWAATAKSSAACTVTLGWGTGNANAGDAVLTEWSGLTGSATEDGTSVDGTGSGATINTPSYTPTVTGSLVINQCSTANQILNAPGAPWTGGDHNLARTGDAWSFLTGTAGTQVTANQPQASAAWNSMIFGIQAVGGGGSGSVFVPRPVMSSQAMWRSAYR